MSGAGEAPAPGGRSDLDSFRLSSAGPAAVPAGSSGGDRVGVSWLLTLGGMSAFGPLAMDMYIPGLPELGRDLGASETSAQLSLSLCMIGLALGQLIAGPLSDRVGRRGPLLGGVGLFALSSALCAMAPSIEALLVMRLLNGVGGGAGIVTARAMVRDRFAGADAARIFSLLTVVLGAAPVLAPLLGGQVLRVVGWRGVFGTLAVLGVVLLAAGWRLPETLDRERRHSGGFSATGRALVAVLRDRRFLGPALVLSLSMSGLFTYIAMGSFVLQGAYHLDAQTYSVVFGVNALGIVVTGQVSARLVRRVAPRFLLGIGVGMACAASVALCAGVAMSSSLWALLPPLFVIVSCAGLVMPNATALAMADQRAAVGSAAAILGLLQFTVGAAIPPLASLAGVTPRVMAVTILLTAAAAVGVLLTAKHPGAPPRPRTKSKSAKA